MLRLVVLSLISCYPRYPIVVAFMFVAASTAVAQADDAKAILEHMAHLRPLVGNWDADYEFHDKDGKIDVDPGTWKVSWMLDGTYLQVQAEHHRRENPSRHRSYITFITYDPVAKKYVSTFFYNRVSLRVTEDGLFDEQSKELRTITFIPLEDGKRDEHVRTIYKLTDANALTYLHYSRYSDEPSERLNLVIKLHRQAAPA